MAERPGVRIRCNLGGCWLECDRCGVLDQGDSPTSMERMKRTEKSHVCPTRGVER